MSGLTDGSCRTTAGDDGLAPPRPAARRRCDQFATLQRVERQQQPPPPRSGSGSTAAHPAAAAARSAGASPMPRIMQVAVALISQRGWHPSGAPTTFHRRPKLKKSTSTSVASSPPRQHVPGSPRSATSSSADAPDRGTAAEGAAQRAPGSRCGWAAFSANRKSAGNDRHRQRVPRQQAQLEPTRRQSG